MMRGWWLRVARLLRFGASERDIEDELRHHIEMETEALVGRGVSPREARRRARLAFGGEDRYREETRGARATAWVEDGLRDARVAVRGLQSSPGFALSALGTLALGVGATTAIFSVVRGVVLAPLPYPEPDELVTVWMSNPAQGIDEDITSWPNFADWRAESAALEHMVGVLPRRWALTGEGDAQEVFGAAVTRGFFEMLGAPLALGRAFREGEAEGDPMRVAVLSHELWVRRFGADPAIVGRTIQLNDEAWEVVGVTSPGQRYPRDAELWVPLSFGGTLDEGLRDIRGALWLPVVGRLADGVTLPAAQAEVDGIAARLREAYPDVNEGVGIALEPIRETLVGDVRAPMMMLLGAVGFVLLIAVVNVASLLLARGTARTREIALRLALGAPRGRLLRQLTVENLVLGLVGGLAGAALAALAVAALVGAAPPELPRLDEVGVSPGLLVVSLVVALSSSVLFGVVPALHAGRVDASRQLQDGARGGSAAGLARLRGSFVTGQFALALVLLVATGLLTRSFHRLRSVDPGFDPRGVVSATISLPASRYPGAEQIRQFVEGLRTEVEAIPGVQRAGTVTTFFLSALPNMGPVTVERRPGSAEEPREHNVVRDLASVGFFEAAGMRLQTGRFFTDQDGPESTRVAIVNEAFVRVFLPEGRPLGERFVWGAPEEPDWITIVGVVADARRTGLDVAVRPSAFVPFNQGAQRRVDLLVRAPGDPTAVVPALRAAVAGLDPSLPLARVRTLEQAMADGLSARRFVMLLLGAFALAATVLAAVGVYGVMAYVVGQRTREIGIRVALGADRGRVLTRVLREGLLYAGAGLVLGALAALGLSGLLRSQLFELEPTDPLTFGMAAAALTTVAALASALPARRAATLDPAVALREE